MGSSFQDAFAEWDDDRYSVDIERFDEQHRRLFGLLNDLHTAMNEGHSEEKVGDILRELERYTEYHFGDEEEFMQDCGYAMDCADCFYNHREAHEEFAERVTELRQKHEDGEYITMEVLTFVRDWLDSHIAAADVDQDYSTYYDEEVEDYEYSPGQLRMDRFDESGAANGTADERSTSGTGGPDVTVAGQIRDGGDVAVPDGPVAGWFEAVAERCGDRPAALVREDGEYVERTFSALFARARRVAGGLLAEGYTPGDRLAILAESGYEWSVVDLACHAAGLVSVPVYRSLDDARAVEVVEAADTDGVVCEAETAVEIEAAAGSVVHVTDLPTTEPRTLPGFEADGDDVATVVFDATESGDPTPCPLTHRNLLAAVSALSEEFPLEPGATGASFLPLPHVYSRVATYYLWASGGAVAYLRPDALPEELAAVDPEVIVGTPKVYQELYGTLQDRIGNLGWMERKLAGRVATYGRGVVDGSGTPLKYSAADRVVFGPLREEFGLTDLEYALSGAGRLDDHLVYFLRGLGVPVAGLHSPVEAAGIGTVNCPDEFVPGSVGRPMAGTEFALDEDGRVLVRGPTVTAGGTGGSAVRTSDDGWLPTGDTGAFDESGYLRLD